VESNKHHKTIPELELELRQIKAAQEDPAHFHPLYDSYYKPIFVFIYRRTANEDLTADLTSTVFLKALVYLKKFEYRKVPFSAWLFRIAINEVNMHFRKQKSVRIISLSSEAIREISSETLSGTSLTETGSSENDDKLLMACITQLPPEAIQLLELRFFENRPFQEVARLLNITEGNAKVKIYRILEKLKAILLKKKINFKS